MYGVEVTRRRDRRGSAKVTDQIRAKLHCKGLGGAGRRARRRTAARNRPRHPPEGTLVARTTGVERESDVGRVRRPGLYPVRRVRCSAVDGAQGKGASRVRSEIKVALRMSCCTVDRTCPWNAASGYFLTVWHHGTRHVPWCQTVQPERAFVADRIAPVPRRRRSPAPRRPARGYPRA